MIALRDDQSISRTKFTRQGHCIRANMSAAEAHFPVCPLMIHNKKLGGIARWLFWFEIA